MNVFNSENKLSNLPPDDIVHFQREIKTLLNGIVGLSQLLVSNRLTKDEEAQIVKEINELAIKTDEMLSIFIEKLLKLKTKNFDFPQLN